MSDTTSRWTAQHAPNLNADELNFAVLLKCGWCQQEFSSDEWEWVEEEPTPDDDYWCGKCPMTTEDGGFIVAAEA